MLALRPDYDEQATSLRGLDRAITASAAVAIALTLVAWLVSITCITRGLCTTSPACPAHQYR
ncbi:hypothetical protein [Streptomyces sp. NRRL F-5755]|uniref:hypothetical protein n=1 Tax=Streptomyces sp. NRRL F-5755 TaxID=1519475 RepID=UPI00133192B8|nr:hypothetical protein [Streptomyces sp. NRRL F-5755]